MVWPAKIVWFATGWLAQKISSATWSSPAGGAAMVLLYANYWLCFAALTDVSLLCACRFVNIVNIVPFVQNVCNDLNDLYNLYLYSPSPLLMQSQWEFCAMRVVKSVPKIRSNAERLTPVCGQVRPAELPKSKIQNVTNKPNILLKTKRRVLGNPSMLLKLNQLLV